MSPRAVTIWTEEDPTIDVTVWYLEEVAGEYVFQSTQPVSNERFFDLVGAEWQVSSSDTGESQIVQSGDELRVREV